MQYDDDAWVKEQVGILLSMCYTVLFVVLILRMLQVDDLFVTRLGNGRLKAVSFQPFSDWTCAHPYVLTVRPYLSTVFRLSVVKWVQSISFGHGIFMCRC